MEEMVLVPRAELNNMMLFISEAAMAIFYGRTDQFHSDMLLSMKRRLTDFVNETDEEPVFDPCVNL